MALETVTLSALVADTGETARTINHWTDIGILRPLRSTDRKGRGNRRYYRAEPLYGERKHALMAAALNRLRIPLAEIKEIIDVDRSLYDPHEDRSSWPEWLRADMSLFREQDGPSAYELSLAGEPGVYMLIWKPHGKDRYELTYLHLKDKPSNYIETFSQDEARRAAQINDRLHWAMDKSETAVLLNLSKAFAPLSEQEPAR